MEEQKFWSWFVENAYLIEDLIKGRTRSHEIYEELSSRLTAYNEYVIAEITGDTDGKYVLILSADGIINGIEPVERLYAAAPAIKRWIIKKFRQLGFVNELNYNGLYVKEEDVKVRYSPNGDLFDVEIFMKAFKENNVNYTALGTLYLDHFIGEYSVMTRIGRITFSRLSLLTGKKGLITLRELQDIVTAKII